MGTQDADNEPFSKIGVEVTRGFY